jgi:hypothetical protein
MSFSTSHRRLYGNNRPTTTTHYHHYYFIDEPPSIAEGGKGVVVPGCPACKKRINTTSQFLDHLANDAMPALLDRLAAVTNQSGDVVSVRQ